MSNSAIFVSGLYKSFGKKDVLHDISLNVARGESYVLIGSSGVGKSVLMKSIVGIINPDAGSISINSIDLTGMSKAERMKTNTKTGMLFQGSALFDSLSIQENVVFGVNIKNKLSKEQAKAIALETLQLVGLDDSVLNQYPAELSGGMQKRVAFARLIATKPEVVFFDEPTSGLDPVMSDVINKLIIKTTKYLGASSFTITHDMKSAKTIADKIAMLHEGRIVWEGYPQDIDNTGNKIVHNFINGISA